MDRGHSQEKDVDANGRDRRHRGSTCRHHRVLVKPTADQDHVRLVPFQFGRDGRAVGDDGEAHLARQRSGDFGVAGAAVKKDRLPR
ncbi:hypothetical protein D3C72_1945310 [compost metagenome]